MDGERRCLVQLSLHQDEEMRLRCLAAAAGVEPATLAHEVLIEGLRRLLEAYGGVDALPPLEDGSHQAWYAEGPVEPEREGRATQSRTMDRTVPVVALPRVVRSSAVR
jgi:hypothetical protein